MITFHLTETDGLSLIKTYGDDKELTVPLEMKSEGPFEYADALDPYIDVILQALHHLQERNGEVPEPMVSSPKTERHQLLKWFLQEELPHGDSKWTKALRRKLSK